MHSCGPLAFSGYTIQPGPWTDTLCTRLTEYFQTLEVEADPRIVDQAVKSVAAEHPFNPLRDYLDGLKWDGVSRIDTWLTTYLGVEDTPYSQAVGPRWLISAVARAFDPGCKVDTALILEGKQGIGKSEALRILAGDDYFKDTLLDLSNLRDCFIQLQGAWIYELGEMEILKGASNSRIKNFLPSRFDSYAPKYANNPINVPRKCVFAGTTNKSEYLTDGTGNRRYWPVRCTRIDFDALKRDRVQLWAEACVRHRRGDVCWLETPELKALAQEEQAARCHGDTWLERIEAYLDGVTSRQDPPSVSLGEVLEYAIGKAPDHYTRADEMRAADCLKTLNWEVYQKRDGKRRLKRYRPVTDLISA